MFNILYPKIVFFFFLGPLVFQEPDLSNLAPQRPMSPDPLDKRDSLTDKQKQGEYFIYLKVERKCFIKQ